MIALHSGMDTWALLVLGSAGLLFVQMAADSCQPVTVSFCQDVGYNMSLYPTGMSRFYRSRLGRIVDTDCSPEIRAFLCSVYSPECVSAEQNNIPPCRMLCERVMRDCEPVLIGKGIGWPKKIVCEQYPILSCANVSKKLCVNKK